LLTHPPPAKKAAAPKAIKAKTFEAPAPAGVSLVTATAGRFAFTRASDVAPHDAHVAAAQYKAPQGWRAIEGDARVARERFSADDALVSFVQAQGWSDWKTQKILDTLRQQGRACGMARLNKLLGRDAKGNPISTVAEAVK
jgi:hypothetical protein